MNLSNNNSGSGGTYKWMRNDGKVKGIVVLFAWISVPETQIDEFVDLYSSLHWTSLVCRSDYLNPFFPEKATSHAFSVLKELLKELRNKPCPVVFAAFSGGAKACMYKIFQIIQGASEAQLSLVDSQLVINCISGQIYDSSPVDLTDDLGARFALHPTLLRVPGSTKLASLLAKGVTSSLDALFITRFGSQRSEYWQTLYSSVNLGSPYLILCSENDDIAPYPVIHNFAQRLQDLGANVQIVKWNDSPHVGHYRNCPIQYQAAVSELLETAVQVFSHKILKYGERSGLEGMHDQICELICDLQIAAVDSNQSLRRVALGPNDHFFLPSSAEHQTEGQYGSLQEDRKERSSRSPSPPRINGHSVLGQVLFDACVPKNIEGWDIKFSGSLNGQPLASVRKNSPLSALKGIRRSRL